jgi:hypothetical protein
MYLYFDGPCPKKHRLGPQNGFGNSGPEKLSKIVNCATIKETEKLKETMVGSKWNRRVATNIHLDHTSTTHNNEQQLNS